MLYNDIVKNIEKLDNEFQKILEDSAKKGTSWEELCDLTKNNRMERFLLDKEKRLMQEPSVIFNKEWNADKITLSEFILKSQKGILTDETCNNAFYATEKTKSDIHIYPSDILMNKYRNDFSFVLIFNN